MENKRLHVLTGGLGYSGKYIAKRLIDQGLRVRTITSSVNNPNPFGSSLEVHPLDFNNREQLVESLRGADVLYNTYWVRFNYKSFTHRQAVENTKKLFLAAKEAGVKRIVHVSITNPSADSPLSYFRGKAELEKFLLETGIPCTILRPAVLFGKEDILINNIAWMIRKLPLAAVFGKGDYKLQPIYVEDFADLAVAQGKETGTRVIDAIGPETFTYKELILKIMEIIGKRRKVMNVSHWFGHLTGTILGKFHGDVMITRDEIRGLSSGLLYTQSPPAGQTRLTDWCIRNRESLGIKYASELDRRNASGKTQV